MKPVTIVKRFLNRTTPSIPLPGDIDEESTSPSRTCLLGPEQLTPTTTTIACQTMASPHPFYETPRSNMGKNQPRQETDALLPPSFRPRSKLPKLNYGGLQPPNLHCFASSLNITIRLTSHKHPHFSKQQQNHCHHQPLFERLPPPYNLQLTKMNQILKEPGPFCGISSTTLDSHPNYFVNSQLGFY